MHSQMDIAAGTVKRQLNRGEKRKHNNRKTSIVAQEMNFANAHLNFGWFFFSSFFFKF